MKKVLFLSLAVLCLNTVFAGPKKKKKVKATTELKAAPVAVAAGTAIKADEQAGEKVEAKAVPLAFKESKHSFGKIKQGTPVTYAFTFKNATGAPVVIESATAQCGCTTPKYPTAPIAKGASEKIEVTYNAASVGSFTKQVTVRVAKNADPIMLTIEGEVLANAAPAPEAEKKD
jgi:hypothetical protein